jgi:large subunit ribosomal protein L25
MSDILVLQPRTPGTSKAARAVRKAGFIPGILYGRGKEPVAFQVERPILREALTGEGGRHAVLKVTVPGRKAATHAVLKDYQLDPVRDTLIHLDLIEISMSEKMTSTVAVRLQGDAPGVRDGGVLEQQVHEIELESLPGDLPAEITVDISELEAGNSIRISDLTAPKGVEFRSDPDTVLAAIIQPTTMEQIEAEQAEAVSEPAVVSDESDAE